MATTNLIADFLIIGICGLVWMLPSGSLLWDLELDVVNNLGLAPSFALLGAIYVVGICINRLADDITDGRNNTIRDEVIPLDDSGRTYHNRLNEIVVRSESAANYLSYRRSIVRITRACALNFFLGVISWSVFLVVEWRSAPEPFMAVPITAVVGSLLVTVLLARAWPVVLRGYFSSVRDMHRCLSSAGEVTE